MIDGMMEGPGRTKHSADPDSNKNLPQSAIKRGVILGGESSGHFINNSAGQSPEGATTISGKEGPTTVDENGELIANGPGLQLAVDDRLQVLVALTVDELNERAAVLEKDKEWASSTTGRVLSSLGIGKRVNQILSEQEAIVSGIESLREQQPLTLEFVNSVRAKCEIDPQIAQEQLAAEIFTPVAESLTGVETTKMVVDLMHRRELDLNCAVTTSQSNLLFTYSEAALIGLGGDRFMIEANGNPFSEEFAAELKAALLSDNHLQLLGVHQQAERMQESPVEQAERMALEGVRIAQMNVAGNYPEVNDYLNGDPAPDNLFDVANADYSVEWQLRIIPDSGYDAGNDSIPHVDMGNGTRTAVLVYKDGTSEPAGTRVLSDAAFSASRLLAGRAKYEMSDNLGREHARVKSSGIDSRQARRIVLGAESSEVVAIEDQFLLRRLGEEVKQHLVKTDIGQVCFFKQANDGTGKEVERDSSAPIHYGPTIAREEKADGDTREGISRVAMFIAPTHRVEREGSNSN